MPDDAYISSLAPAATLQLEDLLEIQRGEDPENPGTQSLSVTVRLLANLVRRREVVNRSGDRTLSADDEFRYQRFSGSGAQALELPARSALPYQQGMEFAIAKRGSGLLTTVPGSGVTVNAPKGGKAVLEQGDAAVLVVVAEDEGTNTVVFDLIGSSEDA